MNNQQIIIAVAKLDGWICKTGPSALAWWYNPLLHQEAIEKGYGYPDSEKLIPDYLHSRDAIIPVIEKQNLTPSQWNEFFHLITGMMSVSYQNYRLVLFTSARQLCVALLKATGNYE